jgi:hypothetical protein
MGIDQWQNFFVMVGGGGLYVASVAMVLSFAFFISGAWLLIIGVYESQAKYQ